MYTCAYLKERFEYNKEDGVLRWKDRPRSDFISEATYKGWRTKCLGKAIGSVKLGHSGKKYLIMRYRGTMLRVHRIIWCLVTGEYPEDQIDHINGNGLDNRWDNLRAATHLENCRNARLPAHNTSGHIGVWFDKRKGKWRADIGIHNKTKKLGVFIRKEDAISARKAAEIRYGFHKNHGAAREL